MLVDEVQIMVQAGNGGDGLAHFLRTKQQLKGGPDGGDGGGGGNVYFVGVEDITALGKFRFKKEFAAESGQRGGPNKKRGASGKDLVLALPAGTVIRDIESDETWEITRPGERLLIARGGRGGRGNTHFATATHQTPREYEKGELGQMRHLNLELRLIADIGFIGFPSVGKSSLLNELTAASVKTAEYPFTTLEPNLGVMDHLILADLPGLIEGASLGKGLGIKFLKHIKRTKALAHVISAETLDPLKDYEIIRKELGEYDCELLTKPEIIVVNKADLVLPERVKEIENLLKKTQREIIATSIYDDKSLQKLKEKLKLLVSEN